MKVHHRGHMNIKQLPSVNVRIPHWVPQSTSDIRAETILV